MEDYNKLELKNTNGEVLIRLETPIHASIAPIKTGTVYLHKRIGQTPPDLMQRHMIRNEDLENFAICILSVLGYKIK